MPEDAQSDPILADFMQLAEGIAETPPPYPAIWILIEVMRSILDMTDWAARLKREEKGEVDESTT